MTGHFTVIQRNAKLLGMHVILGAALFGLAACGESETQKTEKTKEKPRVEKSEPLPDFETDDIGTPMEDRVAILGLLNKRTGESRDLEIKPGQELRIGKVVIGLRACERTKPWETYPDEGAFVQLNILQRPSGTNDAERWERVFSGWLFKENPGANVVTHPTYDVWVKACRMSFPGEEAPRAEPEAKKPSSTPQSPDAGGGDNSAEGADT